MPNLKFALRTLFKTPFVTIVAIVSLALGIGANAAIFSLFNQLLLQPLPVPEPMRLVNLAAPGPKPGSHELQPGRRLRRRSSATRCSAISRRCRRRSPASPRTSRSAPTSRARGQTQNGEGLLVSGSYFPVLGLNAGDRPAARRPTTTARPASRTSSCSSYAYWQTRFGADPGVLGPAAHRQRPDDDDRRRRAARVRRHDARRQAAGLRADHDARLLAAVRRRSTTAATTGRICSRG